MAVSLWISFPYFFDLFHNYCCLSLCLSVNFNPYRVDESREKISVWKFSMCVVRDEWEKKFERAVNV